MLKIDLGSGGCKQEGFLGVDRFPLENVDIVADLDGRLPFDSNSVDLVYASHSLEHVHDLMTTMREIYRICKHGAQICIVAPYNEQKLNLANPYHICVFNEHTPRFWTDYPDAFIDPEEYAHPQAPHWGLSKSDHSDPGIDLRLVRMEFFYFPEYQCLSPQKQRILRRERLDVCDQVMYHLIVWKGDESSLGRSFNDYVQSFIPYEPEYIRKRKSMEQDTLIRHRTIERDEARQERDQLETQLRDLSRVAAESHESTRRNMELERDMDRSRSLLQDAREENHHLRNQISALYEKIELLNDQHQATKICLSRHQTESSVQAEVMTNLKQDLMAMQIERDELRSRLENEEVLKVRMQLIKSELAATNGLLDWYKAKDAQWNDEVANLRALSQKLHQEKNTSEESWMAVKQLVSDLYTQLTAYRYTKLERISSIFARSNDLWDLVSPAFAQLKKYSSAHFRRSSRYRLVLGDDLRQIPYREYCIPHNVQNLSRVGLALRPLLPASQGVVGVEVVSSMQKVVLQMTMPLVNINPDEPTYFVLPSTLDGLGDKWCLRVFVRDADVPVAVYEILHHSMFICRVKFSPFAELD